MRERDKTKIENMLFKKETSYVGACSKFISRDTSCDTSHDVSHDAVWVLRGKNDEIPALIIKSRSTLIPVLFGLQEIPDLNFLRSFLQIKKIHSVQGLKKEVIVLDEKIKKNGWKIIEIFDYDLMSLDKYPVRKKNAACPAGLVLRIPQLTDLDALAPLQAAYEKEEVLPRGSVFSPAASRINIANIVAGGRVLTAQVDGRLVGKINVSAVSFTRFQVGGVYVHPDFRGKGIASRMAEVFIASLINEGKGVTLFVKKNNLPARSLYTGLGFTIQNDYQINYY